MDRIHRLLHLALNLLGASWAGITWAEDHRLFELRDLYHFAVARGAHLVAAMLIGLYVVMAAKWPAGFFDAWALWNLRAKFFLYAPDNAFAPSLSPYHLDYPPLISILVAAGWRIFGDSPAVPIVLHGSLFLMLVWQFRASIWRMMLVGLMTVYFASGQIADVPLSLFLLGACIGLREDRSLLMGLCLSLAAMTKNEGLLMCGAVMAVGLVTNWRMAWPALGLVIGSVALVILYKQFVGVPNDVMGAPDMLGRILDWRRYALIGGSALFLIPLWYGPPALVMMLGDRLEGVQPDNRILTALGLVLAGYLAVYVVTPLELIWHMVNSMDRLLLHLAPTVVWSTMPTKAGLE